MPDYLIKLDPGAAGGPIELRNVPDEVPAEQLYDFAATLASNRETIGGWVPCAVAGVYRTDEGTLVANPSPE